MGQGSVKFTKIRGKIWEVLLPQDAKVGEESQFWGHLGLYLKFKGHNLGYLSPIFLEAKFGALTRISEANFGAKPPSPPNMEVHPWGTIFHLNRVSQTAVGVYTT